MTDRSQTSSPQRIIPTTTVQSDTVTTTKTDTTPLSVADTQSRIHPSLASTPSPSDMAKNIPLHQIPTSSLNIFSPKPFRLTTSINSNTKDNHESVRNLLSFLDISSILA